MTDLESRVPIRKIIHIDMDAFYASVEQRDNPHYKGKPIAVGGSPEGRGGVVAAASYEARKFGVRSAMPPKRAVQLCPDLIFVYPRFSIYKDVSHQIREIFSRYTDLIEPLSLDEAYLDVTEDKLGIGSALEIAKQIRQVIREELELTASAGVSINKFVAKVATDMNKPDGMTFIGPSKVQSFMEKLPVEKFYGVGKVTAEKMKSIGLITGADLKKLPESDLVRHFGKHGQFLYKVVRGIDNREVHPEREIKSVSAEDTFPKDLTAQDEMIPELEKIATTVARRMQNQSLKGKTITLKVKFSDFKIVTRSQTLPGFVDSDSLIMTAIANILETADIAGKKVRLLGITMSNLDNQKTKPKSRPLIHFDGQLDLF